MHTVRSEFLRAFERKIHFDTNPQNRNSIHFIAHHLRIFDKIYSQFQKELFSQLLLVCIRADIEYKSC